MRIHCRNESHEYECCGGCCCKRDAFIAFHSHWLNSVALVKGVCMQIRIVIGMRAHSSARSFFLHKSKVSRFELNESTFTHTHTRAKKFISCSFLFDAANSRTILFSASREATRTALCTFIVLDLWTRISSLQLPESAETQTIN